MCFYRYNIILIFVFLIYISGYDTVDVIGPQIVNFRNNGKINNMSVVLKNIPRSSKMAGLYFKKYWSTFPYKTINVTGNEAVFENLHLDLDWYVTGRVMRSVVILQNNTKYGDKDVMTMEIIENLEEGDKREVPHACLQSCRIIIDYHETPSTESNLKEARHANPTEDKRNSVRVVSSKVISANAETPSSSYLNLDIYPNTSIIYKLNSKHNVSCIGDNLRVDFDLRLYQIKNDNYNIRASTTSNVLRSELYLTEQDDGTYLRCYIMWAYHTKATKTINLLLDKARHANPTEDKRNSVRVVSSKVISANAETPSSSYLNLDIYPNTSIIYKLNSKHNVSCIGDNLRVDFDLRLYQIKNDNYNIRASTTSNVLRSELYLTELDDGTYLRCYIMWAYHTKATKTINLLLDNSSDVNSAQDETTTILVTSSQATSLNTDSLGVKTAEDETNVVLVVPSQTTSSNGESYWKNFGLVTTIIVIIILLIIIILILIRTQRIKTQGFHRSDRILSNSVSYMNLLKKYDTGFKSNDDTRGIQTNMEIWKKNECYANENHYDVGAYYSYATNGTHKVYCHSENQHYD